MRQSDKKMLAFKYDFSFSKYLAKSTEHFGADRAPTHNLLFLSSKQYEFESTRPVGKILFDGVVVPKK